MDRGETKAFPKDKVSERAVTGVSGATSDVVPRLHEILKRGFEPHHRRVATYALLMAEHFSADHTLMVQLAFGSLLHDIEEDTFVRGLTEEIQRRANAIGAILHEFPVTRNVVLHYRETYGGDGCPGKLKGDHIPLEARLFTVAHTLDEMTMLRPAPKRLSVLAAKAEIAANKGGRFCPDCVAALEAIDPNLLVAVHAGQLDRSAFAAPAIRKFKYRTPLPHRRKAGPRIKTGGRRPRLRVGR